MRIFHPASTQRRAYFQRVRKPFLVLEKLSLLSGGRGGACNSMFRVSGGRGEKRDQGFVVFCTGYIFSLPPLPIFAFLHQTGNEEREKKHWKGGGEGKLRFLKLYSHISI